MRTLYACGQRAGRGQCAYNVAEPLRNRTLLDLPSGGTFSRASTATSGFGRINESTVVDYASGVRRPRSHCGSRMLAIEGAATNLCTDSEQQDEVPPWILHGNGCVANQAVAPDGSTTADESNLTGTGTDSALVSNRFNSGAVSSARYLSSQWTKRKTTNQQFCTTHGGGAGSAPVWYSTSAWRRRTSYTSATTTALEARYDNRTPDGPGTAADLYGWGWQLEQGTNGRLAPSSYIPTDEATATRVAEVWSVADTSIPAADKTTIRTGKWGLLWVPTFGSAEVSATNTRTLLSTDAATPDLLQWTTTSTALHLSINGVNELTCTGLSFSAFQPMLVLVDLVTSAMEVRYTSNGTVRGTGTAGLSLQDWTTLYVGSTGGTSSWADSWLGEVFQW